MAYSVYPSSRSPKEAPLTNGYSWCWSKVVMAVSLGRCTASCTGYRLEILGLGSRGQHTLHVAMHCAVHCENGRTCCGIRIEHLGRNAGAWNATFAVPSTAVVAASFQSQATTCLTDTCTAFLQNPLSYHPFRCPTNHAQRLCALRFARAKHSRLLWSVACDKAHCGKKYDRSAAKETA